MLKIFLLFIVVFIVLCITINLLMFKKQEYFSLKDTQENLSTIKTVIVLHGITRTNRTTYLLAKRISKAGYEVYNISYPSTKYTIQELSDFLNKKFVELKLDKKKDLAIVAHSMGGLLTRAYITKYKPKNIKKVVMIATPNHGSEVADFVMNNILFKLRFGIAGQQLGCDQEKIKDILGEVNYDLGIIAGKVRFSATSWIIPGVDDGLVSVESTKLNGMNDHKILRFSHTIGLFQKNVANEVIYYLENSKFKE